MALYQPKHCPIIKLYLHKLMNEILECRNDYMRNYCRCILQSKRHHSILKAPPFSHKGHLASILRHDLDLMVPREPISEWICFLATNIIQHFIDERSWKGIYTQTSFNFLRSTHILTSSFLFFSWTTIGLTQSNSSTGSIISATSILSNSKGIFSLYLGLRR